MPPKIVLKNNNIKIDSSSESSSEDSNSDDESSLSSELKIDEEDIENDNENDNQDEVEDEFDEKLNEDSFDNENKLDEDIFEEGIKNQNNDNDYNDTFDKFSEDKDNFIFQIDDLINKTDEKVKLTQIPENERSTDNFLTEYEKIRILGIRTKQIIMGSKPMVKYNQILNPFELAKFELKNKSTPLIIKRVLPNNKFELWKLNELNLKEGIYLEEFINKLYFKEINNIKDSYDLI